MSNAAITPLGDSVITIRFGDSISDELSQLAVGCAQGIEASGISGVYDVVTAYASVAVHYDPLTIGYRDLRDRLSSLVGDLGAEDESAILTRRAVHVIPVRYDGEDLDEVAARLSLATSEVIAIHTSLEYRVFVLGFVPGFAYLGRLDERLALPRREVPRKRVSAGAVAIADRQTGIYPSATPGGWHLIGSADVSLFDSTRVPPSLFVVGDRVRFEAVT